MRKNRLVVAAALVAPLAGWMCGVRSLPGGSGALAAAAPVVPRCRSYQVQHPVYPSDHPIWSRSPGVVNEDVWVDRSNEELRARIDERGARLGDNRLMLRVLKRMAHQYALTKETRYAYKCAVILDRYAEVIGVWPFFDEGGKTHPHDVALLQYGVRMPPHYGSFWGEWHPYDLQQSHPLALAYDQIAGSGQMERLGQERGQDVRLRIERDLLYANLAIADRYPAMYGNTEADLLEGMLAWGQALGDPELVHRAIRFGDGLRKISYTADAFWHEGSPSYHMMISGRWALNYPAACLAAYSDPPGYKDPVDGTRFDRADLVKRYAPFLEEAARTMQQWVLPNGHYAAVHDTHWKSNTADRWDCYGVLKNYKPSESRPLLHTWSGHAVLGRGRGADQVQAHLHFSGTDGHEHADSLNFFLWAKNKELLSETEYQGNRAWQASTAGHNTVVVDEQNQYTRGQAPKRKFSEIDDVPGVEGFWFARTHVNHGDVLTDGMLRLFATDGPGVQVVEADGHRAYPADRVKLYRRTLAMVESGGNDVYFVDIFRVRGGKVHDWMLHGPLQDEYAVKTSLEPQPRDEKLHTWLEQLRSARTDGTWQAEFVAATGETLRTTMLGAPGTEVILAQAPAMRREGAQPFLDARRAGPESVFVAVHEPYTGRPRVRSVKLLPPERASAMAVAVQVELEGRTDTLLSTLDEAGEVASGGIALDGHFGYVSTAGDGTRTLYVADARSLRAGQASLASEAGYTGAVTKTLRALQGDALNAFVTDARLPQTGLAGKLLLATDGDGSTRGFWVKSVTRQAEDTVIAVDRDPGMSIEKGYVKLQYYPNWGIRGGLRFRIVATATKGGGRLAFDTPR